ncbi:MAG: N-acetylmuramoyl-L-alanine amidase [Paludibacter sp.]|nr:N-acetylmuramoyl-L-alanine amidase [Paludibacter sp.]
MKFTNRYFLVSQFIFISVGVFFCSPIAAQDSKFTIVLDAGHGGHDPGALGSIAREKDINLAVTLDLGALIEQNFKDVRVVYTRKTDKYLTLQERADIVNDHHADLFICIHTNSSPSPAAFGTETFTLGLAKTKANLDVAMRENSVILLEEDYRSKYKGFDPNSVDSYIMFEFMQDKYLDRSVEFSSTVQNEFVNYCHRTDHGVRQAGFWVLHRSACPSVLIELGFISNGPEERYLTSEQGQKEMATGIYKAVVEYKRAHDKKTGRLLTSSVSSAEKEEKNDEPKQEQPAKRIIEKTRFNNGDMNKKPVVNEDEKNTLKETVQNSDQNPVFKVQLFAARKALDPNAADFKGVSNVDFYVERGYHKYTLGAETDYSKIEKIRREILSKFPDAFIIAFVGDKKLSPQEVLRLSK